MPVAFDTYDPEDPRVDCAADTNAGRILAFLLSTPGVGYTPGELAAATDVPRGSVGPTLDRLADAGLVRHKEPYWAAVEDERLTAGIAAVLGIEAAAETDDWYARNEDWADDLPDLSEPPEED